MDFHGTWYSFHLCSNILVGSHFPVFAESSVTQAEASSGVWHPVCSPLMDCRLREAFWVVPWLSQAPEDESSGSCDQTKAGHNILVKTKRGISSMISYSLIVLWVTTCQNQPSKTSIPWNQGSEHVTPGNYSQDNYLSEYFALEASYPNAVDVWCLNLYRGHLAAHVA